VTGTLQGALFRKIYQRDQPQSDANREGKNGEEKKRKSEFPRGEEGEE